MKCSNCRWRLLKVRCNNGSSAIAATTTIITTSSSSWPTLQRQQHSSSSKQVFCVALLCQPKYPSARAPDWLCAGICIAFALPSFAPLLAGGFSVTWLCYTNFNGSRPARYPPCVAATAAAWRLLLSLSVVAPKRFAFCLFCVNLKSALVMRLQQQQQQEQ